MSSLFPNKKENQQKDSNENKIFPFIPRLDIGNNNRLLSGENQNKENESQKGDENPVLVPVSNAFWGIFPENSLPGATNPFKENEGPPSGKFSMDSGSEESEAFETENHEIDEHLLSEKNQNKKEKVFIEVERARKLSQIFTFKSKAMASESKSQFLEVPSISFSDSKKEISISSNQEITIPYGELESPDAKSLGKWKEMQAEINSDKNENNDEVLEEEKIQKTSFIDFDHYVNSFRGIQELKDDGSELYYPKYKVDKILVLKGKKVRYPWMIISSRSRVFLYWCALQLICIIFDTFAFPLLISFIEPNDIGPYIQIMIWTINTLHILDLLLVFRRTFFEKEKNEEVVCWREIGKHELRSWSFWTSLLATLPWQVIIYASNTNQQAHLLKYFVVLRLLKLIRLNSLYHQMETAVAFKRTLQACRAVFLFVLLIHLLTCMWYAVVMESFLDYYYSSDWELSKRIWIPPPLESIQDFDAIGAFYIIQSKGIRYVWTMYSIVMLMSGNEIFPPNVREAFAATFISVCGAFTLGYVYGNMSMAIENLSAQSLVYYNTLDEVQVKMEMNHISQKLQRKVYEYLEYCWKKQNSFNDDNVIFASASQNQQRDICFFRHQEVVLNVPLFKALEPVEVLSIIQKLKTNIYMPGDKIIREGEKGQEMYFITEGTCEVVIKRTDKNVFFSLTKRQYFGEVALISNSTRTSDVNALEFCILEMFTKKDYLALQEEYPGIKKRLRAGLKSFKMNALSKIRSLVSASFVLKGLLAEEMDLLVADYLEDVFLDPKTVILKPKKVKK